MSRNMNPAHMIGFKEWRTRSSLRRRLLHALGFGFHGAEECRQLLVDAKGFSRNGARNGACLPSEMSSGAPVHCSNKTVFSVGDRKVLLASTKWLVASCARPISSGTTRSGGVPQMLSVRIGLRRAANSIAT